MNPLYPLARIDLLGEAQTQPKILPRLVILHTNASPGTVTPAQLRAYMGRADVGVECTFDVGSDGAVWQYMPANVRADCNYQANPFAVSIETQDRGSATLNVTPWTRAQVDALVEVLAWLRDEWQIPMVRAAHWSGSGVGAHRDFPQWSLTGHSCPGDARFAQVPDIIARAAVFGRQPPQPPAPNHPTLPAGLVPLYTEESDVNPYRITNPNRPTQLIRWPSGALGWCSHAEAALYPESHSEPDTATFDALVAACTVPAVPSGQ
jgi:hypothetical protein